MRRSTIILVILVLCGLVDGQTVDPDRVNKSNLKHSSDYANDIDAMVVSLGAGPYTVHVDADAVCSADTTTGSGIIWVFDPGVNITVNMGVTLTVHSPDHIHAGARQRLWTLRGSGTVRFARSGTVRADWWGAIGDGNRTITAAPAGTDNATSLQAALDCLAAPTGGTLLIPAACYEYATTLRLPANVKIIGEHWLHSILRYTGNGGSAITTGVADLFPTIERVSIVTTDQRVPGATQGAVGVRVQGTTAGVHLTAVYIAGFSSAGVQLLGTVNDVAIDRCYITNCGDAAGAGVHVPPGQRAINAVRITNSGVDSNNGWGIKTESLGRQWLIAGCTVQGNTDGGISGRGWTGCTIRDSYFENSVPDTSQIHLAGLGGAYNMAIQITGNLICGPPATARLNLDYVDGLVVQSNHFRPVTGYQAVFVMPDRVLNYRMSENKDEGSTAFLNDGVKIANTPVITDARQNRRAGSGAGAYTAAGRIAGSIVPTGTDANRLEKVLATAVIPSKTLTADGQAIRLTAWGTTAANSNVKTIRIRINGLVSTAVHASSGVYNAQNWRLDATIVRTAVAAEEAIATGIVGTTITATDLTTHRASTNTDMAVVVTGQNGAPSANDIVCNGFIAEYIP